MSYAKIVLYLHVHFLFPKVCSTYVMIFQFVKDISDLFVCQVAEWAYLCIYFLWNDHCLVVAIHSSFPGLRDCIDKCIIFEQQPAVCAVCSVCSHDVTIDPQIL